VVGSPPRTTAIRANGLLFVYGQVASRPDGSPEPEHFERDWAVAAEYWGEAPHPTATAVGVTWLSGFQFEIKVIAKLPEVAGA
jgi:enamine deaminase RidA (YjgF/YER057c/UK114 family)